MVVTTRDLKEWGITKTLDDMMCDELFGPEKTMTDDLVKRLRVLSGMTAMVEKINFGSDSRAMSEAADRIEQLEAALREIEMLHYDSETDFHHDAMKAHHIARAALKEKKDD